MCCVWREACGVYCVFCVLRGASSVYRVWRGACGVLGASVEGGDVDCDGSGESLFSPVSATLPHSQWNVCE